MSHFPTVAKNTLAQGLGRTGAVTASLVTTAILTRLLGVSGYGNYIFIISLIMFLVAISDWGSSLIFVRESVKKNTQEKRFFGNAFLFRLVLASMSFLLINILIFVVPQLTSLSLSVKIASLLLLLISLKTSCHIIFQVRLKFQYLALTDLVVSFSFLGLLLLLFYLTGFALSLAVAMAAFVAANLLGTLLALFFAARLAQLNFKPDKAILKKILFEAMPTGALLLIFSIYNRLDIFLLQILKGAEPVGIYGLAYKVHDNLILGSAYLTAALFPVISGIVGQSAAKDKLAIIYRKTFDLLLVGGLVVVVIVFFLAPPVVYLIGGAAFSQSTLALRILIFATLLAYLNHLTGYTLIALGKQKVSLMVAMLALAWNLGLNLIFIPHYSYLAAAVITIATEGLVLILTSFYLARKFSLRPSLTFPQTIVELVKTRGKIF